MKPDWEGFARSIMESWPEGDVDGGALQEIAENYGLIREEPGGYDEDKHGPDEWGDGEPGQPWYVLNYVPKRGK